jgi:pyruvate formate lyase activating enzyme
MTLHEAMLYDRKSDGQVQCYLCAHRCKIKKGKRGICGVRENCGGTLYSLVYGQLIAENVDPIEKKPLFHVYPSSKSFSIATAGCNFRCEFCQNYDISQMPRDAGEIQGRYTDPTVVVERAVRSGSQTVAYTYTEPTIYFEYAYDISNLARGKGVRNVFVTNGFMTGETLEMIAPSLDAANVDLKAFTEDFYRRWCGARLEPVLETIRKMRALNIWVEVTTLLIPTLNDSEGEIRKIAEFIAGVGTEIPWHVSRFYPRYMRTDLPPTEIEVIHKAARIGKEAGLKYVYCGNVPGDEGEKTFCAACGELLIGRVGYSVVSKLRGSSCPRCKTVLEGIF